MRPVGDAMAIAMRDVEKIDRKILVADLQIFATSVVANVGIFRCFSGAILNRFLLSNVLSNICDRFLLANSSKRSKYGIFATFATTFASTKTFATSKFIECLQIIIIVC